MARRIGFGDSERRGGSDRPTRGETVRDADDKRHAAPKVESKRAPDAKNASVGDASKSRNRSESDSNDDAARIIQGGARLFLAGFMLLWLMGWSYGIAVAMQALMEETYGEDGFSKAFLFVWLALAAVGWLFVARILIRVVKGEPIRRRRRDQRTGADSTRFPKFPNDPDDR